MNIHSSITNVARPDAGAPQLPEPQRALLNRLLEQMLSLGVGVPALKFRAENYSEIATLDRLETSDFLKRKNDTYAVQSAALPFLDSEAARLLLSNIEHVYAALRAQYHQAQQTQVSITLLATRTQLSVPDVIAALQMMLDTSIWCAGWSTDLLKEDAFVSPGESVLKYETYARLVDEVRSWSSPQTLQPHFSVATAIHVNDPEPREAIYEDSVLRAWPAVRACLQEFSFYDIKEIAGLAGFDVTAVAHLVQKSRGGATKGQLMSTIDEQVGLMDSRARSHFLTILIEETLRRRSEMQEKLSEYLSRLGWSFVNQTLVPLEVFDVRILEDTPEESHKDLLKAAQRLRDGDLGGAISAACGAVDTATSKVYEEESLGDPTKASFQERCKRAASAKGVLTGLDRQLGALGWPLAEVSPFKKNLEGALNQGAYVMQTLRSHMGDVHGTKPILRPLVFDCLRWAELIVGSLVNRPDAP